MRNCKGIYRAQGARSVRRYGVIDPLQLREGAVITAALDHVRADEEVSRGAAEVRYFVVTAQELEHDIESVIILGSFDVDIFLTTGKIVNMRIFQPQTCDLLDNFPVKVGTGCT